MSRSPYLFPVIALLALLLAGCGDTESSADKKQKEATQKLMSEAERQLGMPAITNFQERRLAKMIFELRDQEDLTTYAYIVNHMTGKLVFLGKCIGFGLPYSVQYTNPSYITEYGRDGRGGKVLPQPDPNGLFMPQGLSATWLMMLDPETKETRPVYVEPQILVSPFPLHSD